MCIQTLAITNVPSNFDCYERHLNILLFKRLRKREKADRQRVKNGQYCGKREQGK